MTEAPRLNNEAVDSNQANKFPSEIPQLSLPTSSDSAAVSDINSLSIHSFDPQISRRSALRGIGALGIAIASKFGLQNQVAMGQPSISESTIGSSARSGFNTAAERTDVATANNIFDGGDPEVDLELEGNTLLNNFSDISEKISTATTDEERAKFRVEMSREIENNIEVFKKSKTVDIIDVVEENKAEVGITGYGSVSTPLIDLIPDDPNPHSKYFLSADGDPQVPFPNLTFTQFRTSPEGDPIPRTLNMQGMYLGRNEFPTVSSIGDLIMDVGYFGQYIGDPASGNRAIRIVMPVFLGWRTSDNAVSHTMGIVQRNAGDGKYQGPFNQSKSDFSIRETHLIEALDKEENMGSIVEMQINTPAPMPPDLIDQINAIGWAPEFYEVEKITKDFDTALNVFHALQNLVLKRANEDGYVLNEVIDQKASPSPIPEKTPEVVSVDNDTEIGKIPNYKDYINRESLTIDETSSIPRLYGIAITPTSSRLTV